MSGLHIREHFPLKDICTFGIGGPATALIEVHTCQEMQAAIALCASQPQDYIVVGKGSNVLFSDAGFAGTVIVNKIDFCQDLGGGAFYVGAGHSFSLLGTRTARKGWSGLEFAAGIPASVGGAIYMNAGANGKETCEHLTSVEIITQEGFYVPLKRAEIDFAYRFSSFQKWPKAAIVAASFQLSPCSKAREKQQQIIKYRSHTQPYKDKSAGCIFANPKELSAGALIEQCHLKGFQQGGAQISTQHANFIVNCGQATCQDVLGLIEKVQKEVWHQKKILLEPEIRLIPYKLP